MSEDYFYKENETDQIYWLDTPGRKGEYLFSFDKKTIFNFFEDFPQKLSKEQIEIFIKEQPTLSALKIK